MRVSIHDRDALLAVSPVALSAYARAAGWSRHEPYRVHSDVYVGDELPEIIIPRTERIGRLRKRRGDLDKFVRKRCWARRIDRVSFAGHYGS